MGVVREKSSQAENVQAETMYSRFTLLRAYSHQAKVKAKKIKEPVKNIKE